MRYIIEGPATGKVLQENRIRIARGELRVTPLAGAVPNIDSKDAPVADDKQVTPDDSKQVSADDSKEVLPTDEKTPAKVGAKKSARTAKK